MNILLEYISYNYMTLMLLAGLTVILTANRKMKINGVQYVWAIMAIVLVLTICEYVEVWCDTYNKDYHILYPKTMLVYWLFPMTALLEIYLVVPVRHKLLLAVPQIVNMLLTLIDLFGTGIVYSFNEKHSFVGGVLRPLPLIVVGFYVVLLTTFSIQFISRGSKSKGIIVIFMAFSTLMTILGEYTMFARGYTESIAAMDMLVYYFYLAATHQSQVQTQLHEHKIELEKSKNALLLAQIQPHFIFNALMAIRSQCMDYPEVYESVTNFSHYLRSSLEVIGEDMFVSFREELRNIEAYLSLEKLNYGQKLKIEYDVESDDFLLPALSVQPLVENAVRHGIGTRKNGGTVKIVQRDEENRIIIEIIDDGQGFSNITEQQKKRRSIGIENVRARLQSMNRGELEIFTSQNGTTARITINEVYYEEEIL